MTAKKKTPKFPAALEPSGCGGICDDCDGGGCGGQISTEEFASSVDAAAAGDAIVVSNDAFGRLLDFISVSQNLAADERRIARKEKEEANKQLLESFLAPLVPAVVQLIGLFTGPSAAPNRESIDKEAVGLLSGFFDSLKPEQRKAFTDSLTQEQMDVFAQVLMVMAVLGQPA